MMNGLGGLIELVLASLILGWGFFELRSHRRYKREMEEKARMSSRGGAAEPGTHDKADP